MLGQLFGLLAMLTKQLLDEGLVSELVVPLPPPPLDIYGYLFLSINCATLNTISKLPRTPAYSM